MRSPTSATPEARTPPQPAATNAELIEGFYAALGRRDAEAMIGCYAPDATFRDPVFGRLDHDATAAMWRLLCERGRDLQVRASDVLAEGDRVRAHWSATYTYSATGRKVRNEIDARFVMRAGRIVTHEDRFPLPRWARQALGPAGSVLGLPVFRLLIRRRAAAALARYRAR